MRKAAVLIAAMLAAPPAMAAGIPAELQSLCERLCGGVWRDQDGRGLEYRYELDLRAGVVLGRMTRTDGPKTTSPDSVMVFGWDKAKNQIWMAQSVSGDIPSIGHVTLSNTGFSYTIQLYGSQASYTAEATFDGKDKYSELFSFRGEDGTTGQGGAGPFVRTPE